MSRPIPSITGIVRSARNTPPIPSVSAIVWRSPCRAGISKSSSVAACPPTWTMLNAKSAPSSASRRSRGVEGLGAVEVGRGRQLGAELLRRPARHRLGGLEPLAVDVVERDVQLAEVVIGEEVAEQVARELDAAGADEGDAGHVAEHRTSARVCSDSR